MPRPLFNDPENGEYEEKCESIPHQIFNGVPIYCANCVPVPSNKPDWEKDYAEFCDNQDASFYGYHEKVKDFIRSLLSSQPQDLPKACCESCSDVFFEKDFPTHTAINFCSDPSCPCHTYRPTPSKTREECKDCETGEEIVKPTPSKTREEKKCCDKCNTPRYGMKPYCAILSCSCHTPSNKPEDWEKEFDENVKELRNLEIDDWNGKDGQSSFTVDFGYRLQRDNEVFTVTDFGNIKKFIRSLLSAQRTKDREELVREIGKLGCVHSVNENEKTVTLCVPLQSVQELIKAKK